ncbi:hypothetical protein [Carboxylicivirga sp. RSCT41]|uniref:hypothetical protein n=1 Tax=Carboxylicivirga agarovorans TaxID=3417570 RepID=UPI003D3570D8
MRQSVVKWMMLVAVVVSSCSSDELMNAYSERGAENDKAILLASSDGLDDEIEQLGKTDFAMVSHSMHTRIEGAALEGNGRFVEALIDLGQLMYEAGSSDCYFDELMEMTFDKEYYCNVLYDEGFGVWEWDDSRKNFIKIQEHESEVVFMFPATDATDGEIAVLTVTELSVYDGIFPGKGDVLEDGTVMSNALEALRLNVKVGGELILASNVLSTFNAEGYYDDVAMTFNPKPYNLTGELARDDNKGYWMFSFSNETEMILNHELELSIDGENEEMPVNRIENSLLIKDVIIETKAQTSSLYNELVKIEDIEEGSETYAQSLASAFNEYTQMHVTYVHDKTIIANVAAVAKNNTAENTWWVDLEFELSDGSWISGEEFFDDYLTNFKVELEQIVDEFECKFGV